MILKIFRLPVLLLILVSVLTFSCCSDKEDETFTPDESMLVDTDWLLTGKEGTSDGVKLSDDEISKDLDDKTVTTFDKDKSYTTISNTSFKEGTWSLESITLTIKDEDYVYTVNSLTENTLVLYSEFSDNPDGVSKKYKVTSTFTKQEPFVADKSLLTGTWKMTGIRGVISGEPITDQNESLLLLTNENLEYNSNGEVIQTISGTSNTHLWSLDNNVLTLLGNKYKVLRLNSTTFITHSELQIVGSIEKDIRIKTYTKQ
ncbi:MAG: hypothetical protein HRT66_00500 [Flavobacteriaceae bacterium]|nr:hypothetical protein [Flavobacteriaceae bacterium]